MAFDNLSLNRPDTAQLNPRVNFASLVGDHGSPTQYGTTLSSMDNVSSTMPKGFPSSDQFAFLSDAKAPGASDIPAGKPAADIPTISTQANDTLTAGAQATDTKSNDAQAGKPQTGDDQSADKSTAENVNKDWHSHMQDAWVKDELKEHPDFHPMEGLHPGEIAVGNWEPTKEEKQILAGACAQMDATGSNGPVSVMLPDGSVAVIERLRVGESKSFNPKDKSRRFITGEFDMDGSGSDDGGADNSDSTSTTNNGNNVIKSSNPITSGPTNPVREHF